MAEKELKKVKAKAKAEHEARMERLEHIQNLMISSPHEALRLVREEGLGLPPYTGSLGAWGG